MTLEELITQTRAALNAKIARHNALIEELTTLRARGAGSDLIAQRTSEKEALKAEMVPLREKYDALLAEQREDQEVARLQAVVTPVSGARDASGEVDVDIRTGRASAAKRAVNWIRTETREPAAVSAGQRTVAHPVVERIADQRSAADGAVIAQHGSLGQFVRAMTTSGGSAIVPTVWAADLIDLARAKAAVMRAGATIVPMDAKTVQIGRLTGDPTAAFRAEGSEIPPSDPTFDNVTLTAKTLSAQVVGSMEWFQDAENADAVVMDAIAAAMANQIDLVGLYGGITTGHGSINLATPPNPRGVLAALQAVATSSVLGAAANGTTQTATSYWDEIIDLLFTVRDHNEEPTALIWNSKAARQYAKGYDTAGQPIALPPAVADVPRLTSNQIPSYTQGTMTDRATDVFAGDWAQLLIGQRLDITLQVLTERYADTGQLGIVAHWRGDVQPARPRAFAAYLGLQGSA